jgi:hypothetical protein
MNIEKYEFDIGTDSRQPCEVAPALFLALVADADPELGRDPLLEGNETANR